MTAFGTERTVQPGTRGYCCLVFTRSMVCRVVLNSRAITLMLIPVLIRASTVSCCPSLSEEGRLNRFLLLLLSQYLSASVQVTDPAQICSCLSVYRCHSALMAAVLSFHTSHSVPGRQFAPCWTVCTPPFSPTAAPVPVTIILSPTRKDTTYRHCQQPLVIDLEELVLKLCARVQGAPTLRTFEKTA